MMNAIQFTYGNINTAKTIEATKPQLVADEDVLVKVKYAAIDTALDDVILKKFGSDFLHKRTDPLFLGWHFSGVIEKVGKNVISSHNLKVGDAVFGHLPYATENDQGSLSDYIVINAETCALKPESITFDVAAASTTEALTALQALRNEGGLGKGQDKNKKEHNILINGAGGQVGSAAVQIAKRLGSNVTAICSTKDVERVSNLGADIVIDRRKTKDVFAGFKNNQFDIIFDTPNVLSLVKIFKYVKAHGKIVSTLPTWSLLWGMICSIFSSKSVSMVMVQPVKSDFELLGQWLEDGFQVDIDSSFPVKDMVKAMARNRESGKNGRVVLKVENGW